MARAGDPRTSVRWSPENFAWLEAAAAGLGCGVGTVVQAVVTSARLAAGSASTTQVNGGGVGLSEASAREAVIAGQTTVEEQIAAMRSCEEATANMLSPSAVSVAGGAAPVPRLGAAPARRFRLDVAVARVISPGAGPIAPVDRARAMRLIREGRVEVSGVAAGAVLSPEMLVGPGEVVVRD